MAYSEKDRWTSIFGSMKLECIVIQTQDNSTSNTLVSLLDNPTYASIHGIGVTSGTSAVANEMKVTEISGKTITFGSAEAGDKFAMLKIWGV